MPKTFEKLLDATHPVVKTARYRLFDTHEEAADAVEAADALREAWECQERARAQLALLETKHDRPGYPLYGMTTRTVRYILGLPEEETP